MPSSTSATVAGANGMPSSAAMPLVDRLPIGEQLVERRPGEHAATRPRLPLADRLVVRVVEKAELRMHRLPTRQVARQQEGLEEPGGVCQVPLAGAGVVHRLHGQVGVGEAGHAVERLAPAGTKAFGQRGFGAVRDDVVVQIHGGPGGEPRRLGSVGQGPSKLTARQAVLAVVATKGKAASHNWKPTQSSMPSATSRNKPGGSITQRRAMVRSASNQSRWR